MTDNIETKVADQNAEAANATVGESSSESTGQDLAQTAPVSSLSNGETDANASVLANADTTAETGGAQGEASLAADGANTTTNPSTANVSADSAVKDGSPVLSDETQDAVNKALQSTDSAEIKAAADEQAAKTQEADEAAQDPVRLNGHGLIEQNQHLIEPSIHRNRLMELMHRVVTEAERVEHWTVEELVELSVYLRGKL